MHTSESAQTVPAPCEIRGRLTFSYQKDWEDFMGKEEMDMEIDIAMKSGLKCMGFSWKEPGVLQT